MRLKIVVAILLAGAGLLVLIALTSNALRPKSTPTSTSSTPTASAAPAMTASNNPVSLPASNPPPAVAAATVADTNAAAAHAEYVERRIDELDALAMKSDMQSRDTILSELKNNPDKTIRMAALEAAIQFNDRSVVPPMREIAAQTQDPEEKAAILEAIEYINLPSLTEFRAAQRNKLNQNKPATAPQPQTPGSSQ